MVSREWGGGEVRGRRLSPPDSRTTFYASHSMLCGFQAGVDTALERSETALSPTPRQ